MLLSSSVLSRKSFSIQVNESINKHVQSLKVNLKYTIDRNVEMYRSNFISNGFNTDWVLEHGNASTGYLLRSVPRLFENGACNCVVSSTCQEPLRIGPPNLFLPGLVVSCTPLDGLRLSTLECFFSSSCINIILNHLYYYGQLNGSEALNFTGVDVTPLIITPLNSSKIGRFSANTAIGSIMDEAFVQQLIQTISYENYFSACVPSMCRYEYVRNNDALYIITSLLGLYGGLTVSLRFIVWNLARMFRATRRRFYAHTPSVQPTVTENICHSLHIM